MTDPASSGPFHVHVDADVRVLSTSRVAGRSEAELAALLTGLIQRHAWEAGLEITDPASVHVEVARA